MLYRIYYKIDSVIYREEYNDIYTCRDKFSEYMPKFFDNDRCVFLVMYGQAKIIDKFYKNEVITRKEALNLIENYKGHMYCWSFENYIMKKIKLLVYNSLLLQRFYFYLKFYQKKHFTTIENIKQEFLEKWRFEDDIKK